MGVAGTADCWGAGAGAVGDAGAAVAAPIGFGVPGGKARQAATKAFFFSLASFSAPLFALYSSLQAPAVLRPATVDERAMAEGAPRWQLRLMRENAWSTEAP